MLVDVPLQCFLVFWYWLWQCLFVSFNSRSCPDTFVRAAEGCGSALPGLSHYHLSLSMSKMR